MIARAAVIVAFHLLRQAAEHVDGRRLRLLLVDRAAGQGVERQIVDHRFVQPERHIAFADRRRGGWGPDLAAAGMQADHREHCSVVLNRNICGNSFRWLNGR